MRVTGITAQLRTTELDGSIRFYTTQAGMELSFRHEDFYAGIRAGNQEFHLKLVDEPDPSVAYVRECGHFQLYFATDDAASLAAALKARGVRLVRDVHETAWSTREFVIEDDQGHTLYFGEALKDGAD
ncbi:VOC family protein [Paenibacillus sp. GCM10023250]|uniref:VOC family protein n=1 Tax=Paenibacillus sp. GCM10023250 TaxID=3252648 RepID=UPI0036229B23